MKKNNLISFSIMLSVTVAALMSLLVMAPLDVHAADTIATVTKGSEAPRTYTSFDDLRADLDDWSGQSVVITMTRDWNNDAERGKFDGRLVIPKNSRVVLNMDGYVFDRALSGDNDWEMNGELIAMESGSTLTINGGSTQEAKGRTHDEGVHYSTNAKDYATKTERFKGGVLTGGSSTNGAGGIHVKSDCTLIMNDVTLAGCRAEVPWYDSAATNSGYGGGIWIAGGGSTVKLKNSTITGNHAQEDGGGIFGSNHNNMKVELDNSHVDRNYSRSDGGGIDLDGEELEIKGTNGSTVSGNETPGRGGGIYIWNDEVTVSGLEINDNKAGEGGGVYTLEKTISLLDLEISGNSANTGGGIYVANEDTSITNCKITGNTRGYGVFVKEGVRKNFKLAGSTVIKDNPGEGDKDNLVIEHFNSAYITFALQRGADIGVRYADSNDQYCFLSSGQCPDYRQFLTSDNPDYYITYTNDESHRPRYIAYVRKDITIPGSEPQVEKPEKKILDPDEAGPSVVGKVKAGGETSGSGDDYALIRGYLHHEKTSSGTEDTDNIFYYSDGLFYGDPYTYNDHLATASWTLAFGGTYLREGGGKLESYKYKHTGPRQFYSDIGCPDQNIYVNDSNASKPGTDTIGVTIGSKSLQRYGAKGTLEDTGDILIPIAVRGGGYESEWASNVLLGSGTTRDGEAQGFSEAADQVMSAVEYYIGKYGLEDELAAGKVKFWVSGFSRAGATANITSKRLIEKYATGEDGKNNQVFGYPCEAAKGGTDKAEKLEDKTKYYSIHNLINAGDIVPLVGPEEMGFKCYGVDHYIPGTAAGEVKRKEKDVTRGGNSSEVTKVTTYADNERINSKGNSAYDARRARMIKHLAAIDPSIAFDDYFHSKGLDILNLNFGGNAGDYDGSNMEDFIIDFLSFMQSSAIQSRDAWAVNKTKIGENQYGTIQQAARDTMALLFSIDEGSSASAMERLSMISEAMSVLTFSSNVSMRDLFDDVLGDWHTLTDAEKMKYINYFWGLIKDSGALDFLPDGEAAKLEKNWPVLANMIFTFTDADWDTYPGNGKYTFPSGRQWALNTKDDYMMYACTLAAHLTTILNNHAPELNTAWARTYDSYYDDGSGPLEEASKEYIINWGKNHSVKAPEAYVMTASDDGGETETKLDSSKKNTFTGDQKIYLENEEINGEAIYYDLVEVKDRKETAAATQQLYRGGIDLSIQDPETHSIEDKEYKIKAYSRHYGVNSDPVTYTIDLANDRHEVTVALGGEATYAAVYSEGDEISITAPDSKTGIFKEWKIEDATDGDNKVDVTDKLLADNAKKKATLAFRMPEAGKDVGGYTFARNYGLAVSAVYAGKVHTITVSGLTAPAADQLLDTEATLSFDNGSGQSPADASLPVVWTYMNGEDKIVDSGNAYGKTVYTAEIHVPKNDADGRVFVPEGLTALRDESALPNVIYNSSDGSCVITVTFTETGDGEAKPETLIPLKIQAYDVNGTYLDESVEYKVNPGASVTLTAPDMSNEVFANWNFQGTDIEAATGYQNTDKTLDIIIPSISTEQTEGLVIRALYTPVVTNVAAAVDAPEAGKELPASAAMSVTITNEYEVHPKNVEVTWSPADAKAKYLTGYTATVKLKPELKPEEDKYFIQVRPAGSTGAYTDYPAANIIYSDALAVTLNEKPATYNTKDMSLSLAFDPIKYDLKAVKAVENMEDLPHGSGAGDISARLPKTTKVVASDGTEMDAAINWGAPEKTSGGGDLDASTWKVDGTITLPEGKFNDPDEETAKLLNVSVSVNVREADTVSAPRASLDSGSYLGNQVITLSAPTADSTIYYTLDGEAPTTGSTKYEGEEIFFSRSEHAEGLTIRAIAVKDGMKDSAEAYFEYKFTDEVDVPAGRTLPYNKNEQTGVISSSFYTLEAISEGVRIDTDGSAVATEVGEYEVRAKIAEGMKWKIKVEDGSESTTAEDQTITFSIQRSKFDELAEIQAKDSYDSLDQLRKDIKVVVKGSGKEISEDAYEISYSDVSRGKVTVTVTGRGGFEGTITKTISITEGSSKPVSIDGAEVVLSASSFVYNGRVRRPVIMTVGGKTLKAGTDYTIEWSNESSKNVGSYTVTITGIGNYTGTTKATYKINPKGTKLKKPKKAKKAITVKWKKQSAKMAKSRISGYQIQLATDKKFTKNKKTVNVKGYKKVSRKVKRLKAKKKYYIRIRTYKTVSGKNYYSGWSKVKTAKTR